MSKKILLVRAGMAASLIFPALIFAGQDSSLGCLDEAARAGSVSACENTGQSPTEPVAVKGNGGAGKLKAAVGAARRAKKDDDRFRSIDCINTNCTQYQIVERSYDDERTGSMFDNSYIWSDKSLRKMLARQERDGVWTRLGKAVVSPVVIPALMAVNASSSVYRERGGGLFPVFKGIYGTAFGAIAGAAGVFVGILGLFVNVHYALGGEW